VEKITEAIGFLHLIKDRFPANSAIRKEFFALPTGFSNGGTTNAPTVVARANELLHGHPDLIDRFNAFLDPEIVEAMQFLKRVKHTDVRIYDHVLAAAFCVREERGLDAHTINAQLGEVFGPANGDLLRGFARFLPTMYDPPPSAEAVREDGVRTLSRENADDLGVGGVKRSSRIRAKKNGEDDVPTPTRDHAASIEAACSRRLSRAKKSRVHYDPEPKSSPVSDAVGGSRVKKPCAGNQRAPLDGLNNDFPKYRKAWQFETGYSKLVATMARVEELQRQRAHGEVSLDTLFPSRECREFLAKMYHEACGGGDVERARGRRVHGLRA
jgi:histone deacetylase complex regulatory component SIN3